MDVCQQRHRILIHLVVFNGSSCITRPYVSPLQTLCTPLWNQLLCYNYIEPPSSDMQPERSSGVPFLTFEREIAALLFSGTNRGSFVNAKPTLGFRDQGFWGFRALLLLLLFQHSGTIRNNHRRPLKPPRAPSPIPRKRRIAGRPDTLSASRCSASSARLVAARASGAGPSSVFGVLRNFGLGAVECQHRGYIHKSL